MKTYFTLITLLLACLTQATLVEFDASAQVSYINDPTHHFGAVNLSDLFSVHVDFDTANATKVTTTGVYPDAIYQIGSAPNYMTTHLDSNNLGSDGSYNFLYVTNTHPTTDFMDYQAALWPGEYVEMIFSGPKGTLPSTDIPIGYPKLGWTSSEIRYTWTQQNAPYSSAEIDATTVNPTPEPASMFALVLGVIGALRQRKCA